MKGKYVILMDNVKENMTCILMNDNKFIDVKNILSDKDLRSNVYMFKNEESANEYINNNFHNRKDIDNYRVIYMK